MVTLYNVVSADGYIARTDGSEDFIPDSHWPRTLEVLRKFDCIVMGRRTYETIQDYDDELKNSFHNLPIKKYVITHNIDYSVDHGYKVINSPEEALKSSTNIVVTSGPALNDYLLEKGLVDRIIYHEVPLKIGEGIRPYRSAGGIESVRLKS